jgi:hypothetical protein
MPEHAIEVPYRCLRGGLGVVAYTCLRGAQGVLRKRLRCLRSAEVPQQCFGGTLEVP